MRELNWRIEIDPEFKAIIRAALDKSEEYHTAVLTVEWCFWVLIAVWFLVWLLRRK